MPNSHVVSGVLTSTVETDQIKFGFLHRRKGINENAGKLLVYNPNFHWYLGNLPLPMPSRYQIRHILNRIDNAPKYSTHHIRRYDEDNLPHPRPVVQFTKKYLGSDCIVQSICKRYGTRVQFRVDTFGIGDDNFYLCRLCIISILDIPRPIPKDLPIVKDNVAEWNFTGGIVQPESDEHDYGSNAASTSKSKVVQIFISQGAISLTPPEDDVKTEGLRYNFVPFRNTNGLAVNNRNSRIVVSCRDYNKKSVYVDRGKRCSSLESPRNRVQIYCQCKTPVKMEVEMAKRRCHGEYNAGPESSEKQAKVAENVEEFQILMEIDESNGSSNQEMGDDIVRNKIPYEEIDTIPIDESVRKRLEGMRRDIRAERVLNPTTLPSTSATQFRAPSRGLENLNRKLTLKDVINKNSAYSRARCSQDPLTNGFNFRGVPTSTILSKINDALQNMATELEKDVRRDADSLFVRDGQICRQGLVEIRRGEISGSIGHVEDKETTNNGFVEIEEVESNEIFDEEESGSSAGTEKRAKKLNSIVKSLIDKKGDGECSTSQKGEKEEGELLSVNEVEREAQRESCEPCSSGISRTDSNFSKDKSSSAISEDGKNKVPDSGTGEKIDEEAHKATSEATASNISPATDEIPTSSSSTILDEGSEKRRADETSIEKKIEEESHTRSDEIINTPNKLIVHDFPSKFSDVSSPSTISSQCKEQVSDGDVAMEIDGEGQKMSDEGSTNSVIINPAASSTNISTTISPEVSQTQTCPIYDFGQEFEALLSIPTWKCQKTGEIFRSRADDDFYLLKNKALVNRETKKNSQIDGSSQKKKKQKKRKLEVDQGTPKKTAKVAPIAEFDYQPPNINAPTKERYAAARKQFVGIMSNFNTLELPVPGNRNIVKMRNFTHVWTERLLHFEPTLYRKTVDEIVLMEAVNEKLNDLVYRLKLSPAESDMFISSDEISFFEAAARPRSLN
ncbi:unnamed protein product [Bursaphelenchus xylophilus]|nr:unnamed protein product [Bursaphelenchus xylophilus]CAG9104587.1 unnamed protein product [Bursaphelenchus xylophilus]